ncbi:RluA family pseudouridine synthase, partial [Desulfovibrio sp. 1188_IL3213]|uniref:RluA family pseudouridine synthase n=1 Tax=Desulfovibrio sp. 1188_IL3213 TaxID=3084052 RepID=UPI002FDB2257
CCTVDGLPEKRPAAKVHMGQAVILNLPEHQGSLQPEEGHLELLWQDAHLVVCNKPAGLTVHPCPSCPEQTLVQRLLGRFPQLSRLEGQRPGIVHRLDKDTSGLLVVALTESDRLTLSEAFAERQVHKEYLALVSGLPPLEGQCREPLGRHPTAKIKMAVVPENRGGRQAFTEWRRLWSTDDNSVSLLAVRIHTGRTHQIRVHMAHMGHPLLGDRLYAPKAVQDMAPRQMLHAWRLNFTHPASGEDMRFTCPPPQDMPDA